MPSFSTATREPTCWPMRSTSTTSRSSAPSRSEGSRSPARAIRTTSGLIPRCRPCCTWTTSSTSRRSNRSRPVRLPSSRRFATPSTTTRCGRSRATTATRPSRSAPASSRSPAEDRRVRRQWRHQRVRGLAARVHVPRRIVNLVAPTFAASEQAARIEHNLDTLPTIAAAGGEPGVRVGPRSRAAPADGPSQRTDRSSRCRSPTRSTGTRRWTRGGSRGVSRAVSRSAVLPQRADPGDRRRHRPRVGRATGHPPLRGPWLGIPRRLDRASPRRWTPRSSWSGRAPCSRR